MDAFSQDVIRLLRDFFSIRSGFFRTKTEIFETCQGLYGCGRVCRLQPRSTASYAPYVHHSWTCGRRGVQIAWSVDQDIICSISQRLVADDACIIAGFIATVTTAWRYFLNPILKILTPNVQFSCIGFLSDLRSDPNSTIEIRIRMNMATELGIASTVNPVSGSSVPWSTNTFKSTNTLNQAKSSNSTSIFNKATLNSVVTFYPLIILSQSSQDIQFRLHIQLNHEDHILPSEA